MALLAGAGAFTTVQMELYFWAVKIPSCAVYFHKGLVLVDCKDSDIRLIAMLDTATHAVNIWSSRPSVPDKQDFKSESKLSGFTPSEVNGDPKGKDKTDNTTFVLQSFMDLAVRKVASTLSRYESIVLQPYALCPPCIKLGNMRSCLYPLEPRLEFGLLRSALSAPRNAAKICMLM